MNGFLPGLPDRLMDERSSAAPDLEALLKTRVALDPAILAGYPAARASVLHYGLTDFAGFCLSSSVDRAAVCASLKDAIENHEPRLREVIAELAPDTGNVNRLNFVIHAQLALDSVDEPVNFNAVLQPSSLHYAINRGAASSLDRA